ncbi:MAG: ABC transporter ATP-binding protein [Anaerococcus vaginalis]|nr:ABC transporter ATP-binding protein [Anaerococcus vaginalis]
MIYIENLKKSYGVGKEKINALNGIDLKLESGKIMCLLGPSGSGKSTLLNILGGIETIDQGLVKVFENELNKMNKKDLENYRRENLGFVFQFYNLISDLNVKENIEVGAYLSDNPIDVDELIKNLSLDDQIYKYPNEISGGQAQRTSIARAIIKRPKLLICDEPTGALDYESAKDVLILIEKLNKIYNSTVIIATHNTQISKMCDYIMNIHNGLVKSFEENKEKIPARSVTW